MIFVESTHWPLVVVGAILDPDGDADGPSERLREHLWRTDDIRLAVVISGDHAHAWVVQDEVFAWLRRHRDHVWRCVSRVAWIVEDELMRRNADRWLTLAGDRLFRGEVTTFRSVRSAVSWLIADQPKQEWRR